MSPTSQTHIVGNLKKHTKYEFFIAPFYRSVEGQPSNSKIVQTFEDGKFAEFTSLYRRSPNITEHLYSFSPVPSSPPDNVQTGMLNLTAGWVRWSPPPPQHHNGLLLGYKIQVQFIIIGVVVWPRRSPVALEIHLSILFIGFGCGSEHWGEEWNAKCQMQMHTHFFFSSPLHMHSTVHLLESGGAFAMPHRWCKIHIMHCIVS